MVMSVACSSSPQTHLNRDAGVGVNHMPAGLQEGVVLDFGAVHQHLVAVAVVAVLPRFEPLAVLVHVQEVAEDGDLFDL